jgi:hypothetical protein
VTRGPSRPSLRPLSVPQSYQNLSFIYDSLGAFRFTRLFSFSFSLYCSVLGSNTKYCIFEAIARTRLDIDFRVPKIDWDHFKMHDLGHTIAESQQYKCLLQNSEQSHAHPVFPTPRQSRTPSRDSKPRKRITLMEKIGLWNFITNSVGSLILLGILVFLWFLVSVSDQTSLASISILPLFTSLGYQC